MSVSERERERERERGGEEERIIARFSFLVAKFKLGRCLPLFVLLPACTFTTETPQPSEWEQRALSSDQPSLSRRWIVA